MPRFWKFCPVCLVAKIDRSIVRTCGTKACQRAWRKMSTEERVKQLDLASIKQSALEDLIKDVEHGFIYVRN